MTEHENNVYSFNVSKQEYKPLILFSIYDTKSNKFMPPFFATNEDDGIRQVTSIVNYVNSLINKFPQDYCLYKLGEFDEQIGALIPIQENGFINYLDVYKQDDSVKYDELKKDVNEQKFLVQNELSNLNTLKKEISDSISNMSSLYQKYESSFNSRSHNVNEYAKLKLTKMQPEKVSLLDKLFHFSNHNS